MSIYFVPAVGSQAGKARDWRFFFVLALAMAFLVASDSPAFWEKSFHFLQPSKSIKACMQPHSMTFRSSQTKLTGCDESC